MTTKPESNCSSKDKGWSITRQVRFVTGVLIILGISLSVSVSLTWLALSFIVALGMVVSSLFGSCALGQLIARMPWNSGKDTDHLI